MIEKNGQPYLKLTDSLQAEITRVQLKRGRFALEILKDLIKQHMENPHEGNITYPVVEWDPKYTAKAWGVGIPLVEDAFNALLYDGLLRLVGKSNHDLDVVELVDMEFDTDVVLDEEPLSKPGPTALYRHYSEDNELLYVGISKSAPVRLAQHMAGSPWAREIARVEIVHLPSREEALAAEKEAIKAEKPLWNTAHNNLR